MTTFAEWRQDRTKVLTLAIAGMGILLFWAVMAIPNLMRSRTAANAASGIARQRLLETELASSTYYAPATKAKPAAMIASDVAMSLSGAGAAQAEASGGQKMIRT